MGTRRVLRVRYAGSCSGCGAEIAKGERAWWDAEERHLWCLGCHEQGGTTARAGEGDGHHVLDAGEAGRSAHARYDRLREQREQRIDRSWGPFAGVVKFLSVEPASTASWKKGAVGERRVAQHLQRAIGDRAIFLHDRRIPRSTANIDLMVIASSGVWVVDAKHWSGKVEKRNVGGWRKTDLRLYVGGRDRSKAVEGMARQVEAVRDALDDPGMPVIPVLCFVGADWALFAKPFSVRGVRVTWPRRLAEMILTQGPFDRPAVERAAATLAGRLRPM